MRPARSAAAGTVPAIQIETGTRGSGLTLTPSRWKCLPWNVTRSPASSARTIATSSSSRAARLAIGIPNASNACARPPFASVTVSGAVANAAIVPICSASTIG